MAFAVFTPVCLGIAVPLGNILGVYAARYLGTKFGLVGAFAGGIGCATLGSFMLCLLTLRRTRRGPMGQHLA
jgi:hypothetical protein